MRVIVMLVIAMVAVALLPLRGVAQSAVRPAGMEFNVRHPNSTPYGVECGLYDDVIQMRVQYVLHRKVEYPPPLGEQTTSIGYDTGLVTVYDGEYYPIVVNDSISTGEEVRVEFTAINAVVTYPACSQEFQAYMHPYHETGTAFWLMPEQMLEVFFELHNAENCVPLGGDQNAQWCIR